MYTTFKPRVVPLGETVLRELRALMRDEGWMGGYREWLRLRAGEPEFVGETEGKGAGAHGAR